MNRQFIKIKREPFWKTRKNYKHLFGAVQSAPELMFLSPILSQDGNKCTAFGSVSARASMKKKDYDPQQQWAYELAFQGISDAPNGLSFKTPLAVGVEKGFYDIVKQSAEADKATAYFFVTKNSGMDWFDSIKAALNQTMNPLMVALDWYTDWDVAGGIVPTTRKALLGGHFTKIAGYKTINGIEYIVIQNSWGEGEGDHGLFYFPREIVNANFGKYGIAYWTDDPNPKIKQLGWFQALLQNLIALLTTRQMGDMPPFVWTDPVSARHSVRVICDQEGLSWEMKNDLTACVEVESGFNPQAVHPNKGKDGSVWSTDFGIVQVNDYFNIGPGKPFPSVDYVLNNPESCVRWMCKEFLAGHQSKWASFTSNLYKKYL